MYQGGYFKQVLSNLRAVYRMLLSNFCALEPQHKIFWGKQGGIQHINRDLSSRLVIFADPISRPPNHLYQKLVGKIESFHRLLL